MKALLLEIPDTIQRWMDERARLGHDRMDEMWDGVLHMVPPASLGHQGRGSRLIEMLGPLARAKGWRATYETGVFRPGRNDDYRVPDVVVSSGTYATARGVEGRAELVIEVRSPNDESWEKLPFFAEFGIPEVLILERDEAILLRLDPTLGSYVRVDPDDEGRVELAVLPLAFRPTPGGGLTVCSPTETVDL